MKYFVLVKWYDQVEGYKYEAYECTTQNDAEKKAGAQ